MLRKSRKFALYVQLLKPKRWARIFTKFLLPLFLVWASITSISPTRLIKDNLQLEDVMSRFAQDVDNVPQMTFILPAGSIRFDCPGPYCILNRNPIMTDPPINWEPIKGYLAEKASTTAWRGVQYTRIDTTLPAFAAKKGEKIAFDILGVDGESFRFFVNGIEKARGPGGVFENSIVFESDGGTPGEPLTLGMEIQSGRSFAPEIFYISQPFLSPPAIAPVIRAAYRGNDKEVILPDAFARATVAILAALGCLFTPFYLEILFFSMGMVIWNYMRLLTNQMAPFPNFLNVDFTTVYACLSCLFNASSIAFLSNYFRSKSRIPFAFSACFILLAPACIIAVKTEIFIGLVTLIAQNEYLTRGMIGFMGLVMAVNTWRETRHIETARFRKYIALTFTVLLGIVGLMEVALHLSILGSDIIGVPPASENRWIIRKMIEASMISFGVAIALEWALVVRNRRTVLQRFGMVIDPRVLKEIISTKKIPSVRAEHVVALFVDLRGFTSLCEQESPQEVNLTLNAYLDVVSKAVRKHGGVIDKFVGDEVMALWGIPTSTASDPLQGARCALDIRRRLRDLNINRQQTGLRPLACGVGLHCGPAIVGPVGTAERFDFTAIGPTINLAARLQAMTKEKKCDILISADLYQFIKSSCIVSDLGISSIRGMDQPVRLYRLLGITDNEGTMQIHDSNLEASGLPLEPGVVAAASENLSKAS